VSGALPRLTRKQYQKQKVSVLLLTEHPTYSQSGSEKAQPLAPANPVQHYPTLIDPVAGL